MGLREILTKDQIKDLKKEGKVRTHVVLPRTNKGYAFVEGEVFIATEESGGVYYRNGSYPNNNL